MKRPKMGLFSPIQGKWGQAYFVKRIVGRYLMIKKNCWAIFNDKKELLGDYLENIENYVKKGEAVS